MTRQAAPAIAASASRPRPKWSPPVKLACSFLAALALTLVAQLIRLPSPDPLWSIEQPCLAGKAASPDSVGCRIDRSESSDRTVTLRYRIDRKGEGSEPWALYVANSSSELEVLFNGVVIQRQFNPGSEMVLFRAVPSLVVVPGVLVRPDNELEIRIKRWGRFPVTVSGVHFGPDAQLRPYFSKRWLAFELLGQLGAVWRVLLAAVLLILWFNRRAERAYLIFAGVVLSGLSPALQQITPSLSFFGASLRVGNYALVWQSVLLVPFTFHYCGRKVPGGTARYVWGLAAGTLAVLLLPIDWVFPVARALVVPVMAISLGTTLFVLSKAALRDDIRSLYLTIGSVALVIGMSVFDIGGVFYGSGEAPAFTARYAILLMFAVFSASLCNRFAASLNAVDNFSRDLKVRLDAAQHELAESLRREHAKERETTLHEERDRLVRDLHDGVSGRMLSVIATCELRGGDYADVAQQVRLALGELRLVIASLVDVGGDLSQLIANFAEQAGVQLRQMGIRLHVKTADLPPLAGLRPTHALHIFRILQQAAMNAAVHSGSSDLFLTVTAPVEGAAAGIRIELTDRGNGQVAQKPGGFGMRSMRQRAATLNARLDIVGSTGGTQVILHLPETLPQI